MSSWSFDDAAMQQPPPTVHPMSSIYEQPSSHTDPAFYSSYPSPSNPTLQYPTGPLFSLPSSSSPPSSHLSHPTPHPSYPDPVSPSPTTSVSFQSAFGAEYSLSAEDLELDAADLFTHSRPLSSSTMAQPSWEPPLPPLSPSTVSTESSSSQSASPPPSHHQLMPFHASHSSLSFSAHSAPPPSSSSPSPPTFPPGVTDPKPKRKRGVVSAAQRAELKRLKHREIDAQRRQRENTVVTRLHQLNGWKGVTVDSDPSRSSEDDDAELDDRKDKVSVLEESAAKLAELQELVAQLTATCSTQQEHIGKLSLHLREVGTQLQLESGEEVSATAVQAVRRAAGSPSVLSLLPRNTAEFITGFDRSHALYRSCVISASICLFLVRAETGCVVEANDFLYTSTGWRPEHVIGRLLTAPLNMFMADHDDKAEPGLMLDDSARLLVEDGQGGMVHARGFNQYPKSKRAMRELYAGKAQCITATWRTQLKNGGIYDVVNTSWVGSRDKHPDGKGGWRMLPNHVVFACSTEDAIRVDADHAST